MDKVLNLFWSQWHLYLSGLSAGFISRYSLVESIFFISATFFHFYSSSNMIHLLLLVNSRFMRFISFRVVHTVWIKIHKRGSQGGKIIIWKCRVFLNKLSWKATFFHGDWLQSSIQGVILNCSWEVQSLFKVSLNTLNTMLQ